MRQTGLRRRLKAFMRRSFRTNQFYYPCAFAYSTLSTWWLIAPLLKKMISLLSFEFGCVARPIGKGNLWNHETCRNGAYANLLNRRKFILVSELMIMSHVQLTTNRWVNFDALITNTGYLSKLKIWSTPTKIDLNCLIIPDRLLKIGPRDGCGARFALILRL